MVDQGKVFTGTFHLSDLDLSALGSSEIPANMTKYRNAYGSSLQWLSSFAPKPGQSLSAPYWGKIAAIGGSAIAPIGNAKVTTPAGTFDTTDISWRYGATNHAYVGPNLPFPVKANVFAGVTTGDPPIQYSFELQGTGTGQPTPPKSIEETPKPPLKLETARATYNIELLWEPDPIIAGNETKLGLIFSDSFGNTIARVTYDVEVIADNGTIIDEDRQRADEGTGLITDIFPFPGPYDIKVTITSVEGVSTGVFVESATFNVVAT